MTYIFEHELPRERKAQSIAAWWIDEERAVLIGPALRGAGMDLTNAECVEYASNVSERASLGDINKKQKALRIIANVFGRETDD